jgi:hypothetical protein
MNKAKIILPFVKLIKLSKLLLIIYVLRDVTVQDNSYNIS